MSSISKYLAEIGRKGGKKSRRRLSAAQAKNMVRVREAKRAFKKYFHECFWSHDPNLKITKGDVEWVGRTLMKNGDRKAFMIGAKLCR